MRYGSNPTALALFADSASMAAEVEKEFRDALQQAGAPAKRVNAQMKRDRFVVMLYARHVPSQAVRRAIGSCIYEIRKNRWAGWTGWDTEQVGRAFLEQPSTS
jgi:hypothetical protein